MSRPISKSEALVLERALAVGALTPISQEVLASIHSLQVTATCKCGCATVWFGPDGDATIGQTLAEAVALSDRQKIAVIVWAQNGAIAGLELVGYGKMPLPNPLTIRSYSDA